MDLTANPLNYPTIDSKYYFDCVETLKFYEEKLAKLNNQEIKSDLTHQETLEILAQHDFFYEGLTDLILEGWKIVDKYKDRFKFLSDYNKLPNWVYNDDPTKAHKKFRPVLEKWKVRTERKRLNFFLFFRTLSLFRLMTPAEACRLVLEEKKKSFEELLEFNKEQLENQISQINWTMQMIDNMKSGELEWADLINKFRKGDFSIYQDRLSQLCMETMYQAIEETPGAKMWFISDGHMDSEDPMKDKILHHPKVESCGHTGASISWTAAQFRRIYQEGWSKWVIPIILNYGIGWDEFDFFQSLTYGNERMAIYKLDNGADIDSPYEVLEIAVTKEMNKLVALLLAKIGDKIKKEEYSMLALYCKKNTYVRCKDLLLDKWEELYHRKLNITGLDLEALIKKIWYHKRNAWNKEEPTEEDIKDYIVNQKWSLKGVFINIDWKDSTIDPFDYPKLALL